MNRCQWNRSPYEEHQLRIREYHMRVRPILGAFAKELEQLPRQYIKQPDGSLQLDESYPPERARLLEQMREATRQIWHQIVERP